MLRGHDACAIVRLNFYLLGFISLTFSISQPWPEFSRDACVFNMVLRNFRPILTWKLRNHSIAPTHYTLWYTYMSRGDVEIVQHCANITRPFCDTTHLWVDVSETYLVWLVGSQGNTTVVSCSGSIFPATDMTLEPPRFEIAGFTDRINVVLELPPALPEMPAREGLWLHLSLAFEEWPGGIVKDQKLKISESTNGNFTYVFDKLIPNTNYCVSVYFKHRDLERISRSPLKCTRLQPAQEPESLEPAGIGALIAVVLVVTISISTLVTLKRIGYVCLRNVPPKVLNFHNRPTWVFPELRTLEAVSVLEVVHVKRKKKVWDYNYDDDSDSDSEAVLQASAGGYTTHGLTVRPLCPASGSSASLEGCSDPDAQEDELSEPRAETQSLLAPEPGPWGTECTSGASEGQGTLLADPAFQDDSSSAESPADKVFFNVDLNSVTVRVLDDSDTEVPPLPSLPEETVNPDDPDEMGTSLPVASGQGTQPSFLSPHGQGLWLEDVPSDRSDTSESDVDVDVDIGDGYLGR